MRSKKIAALIAVILMAAVAPSIATTPEAQIVAHIKNLRDYNASRRSVRVERYSVQDCRSPKTLAEVFLKKNAYEQVREKPIKIAAGAPIGVTFSYLDDRLDATGDRLLENRSCAVSGHFTPTPGAKYRAEFSILPGAASCTLILIDETSKSVEFLQRPQVCTSQQKNLKGVPDSAEGYALRWNLRFNVKNIRQGP
jgi:hypothetical protein